jgi:hypothetical protein
MQSTMGTCWSKSCTHPSANGPRLGYDDLENAESYGNQEIDRKSFRIWSGRWESKSTPLDFSKTYEVGLVLIWKDLVVSGTLPAASMPPRFPRIFLTTLRFASGNLHAKDDYDLMPSPPAGKHLESAF